jgi:hypothetical protein
VHRFRKPVVKRLVQRTEKSGIAHVDVRVGRDSFINQLLYFDMCQRFELQVSLCRIGGIISVQSTLQVSWVGDVALDEVRVVGVDACEELSDRPQGRDQDCRL